jgi:hypothetical protein
MSRAGHWYEDDGFDPDQHELRDGIAALTLLAGSVWLFVSVLWPVMNAGLVN